MFLQVSVILSTGGGGGGGGGVGAARGVVVVGGTAVLQGFPGRVEPCCTFSMKQVHHYQIVPVINFQGFTVTSYNKSGTAI